MEYQKCTKCHNTLPATLDYFIPHSEKLSGLSSWCKLCCSRHGKRKYEQYRKQGLCCRCRKNKATKDKTLCEKCADIQVSTGRIYRTKLKKEVFTEYGGCICACCGDTHLEFLTLDYINGGGNKQRKKIGNKGGFAMYCWVKRNKYPSGYRVLCMNCNLASSNGECPHQSEKLI